MVQAELRSSKLNDIVFMGLRATIGVIFIVHGTGKFNPGFVGFLNNISIQPEMQIPIALAETIPGILLLVGVLSRISSSLLSIVMLGAIFYVKQASNLTGDRGFELDLILLASNLVIIVAGPGRISLAQIIKRLPRYLH
ncbi:MAG: DoxX family membrane protein [Nitrosopumilaceae archaeon]|nr:DoxX family protein [Nitrosopumilaceae archaeon]NIT99442.1 DoxX family protein [Nitrosopumilaceae archaeon]NIU85801.1 DoxX family membrane protein [Nitrosopumilaceae archaeon]NIV64658.1 DoxX family membrane protein [Nitrosopumilaceae archaeon]NIX60045.1 DoxX family membrane protein [Nitrosopumilaceae archaeon]